MRFVQVIRVLLPVAAMVALSAGCAVRQAGGVPANSLPANSLPANSVPVPSSSGPVDASACPPPAGTTVTVTEADNGRTVCARVSQRIEIYLHGTVAQPWSAITAAGDRLRPTASGKLSLPVGVTGAVFTALAPGPVEVVSSRPMCSAQPGQSGCTALAAFRVTVSVS
jgi:hypothetical protein